MNNKDKRHTKKKKLIKNSNNTTNNTTNIINNKKNKSNKKNKNDELQSGGYRNREQRRKQFIGLFKGDDTKEIQRLEDTANESPLFPGEMPIPDCTISYFFF